MKLLLFSLLVVLLAFIVGVDSTPIDNTVDTTGAAAVSKVNTGAGAAGVKADKAASVKASKKTKGKKTKTKGTKTKANNAQAGASAASSANDVTASTASSQKDNVAAALQSLAAGKQNNNAASSNQDNNAASAAEAAAASGQEDAAQLASSTSSAASATRTRPCDQGDISLANGLTANVQVGLGEQASVVTLQGLLGNGSASDISDAITRLQQFVSTAGLQLQMALGIADTDSFAQPQLGLLEKSQAVQEQLTGALTGDASDNATLDQLFVSFQSSTDNSQDGANNALIDCFLPLTLVSG